MQGVAEHGVLDEDEALCRNPPVIVSLQLFEWRGLKSQLATSRHNTHRYIPTPSFLGELGLRWLSELFDRSRSENHIVMVVVVGMHGVM